MEGWTDEPTKRLCLCRLSLTLGVQELWPMVLSASVESEGSVVVKTSWTLVKFFIPLEADGSFCHHPCMKCGVGVGGGVRDRLQGGVWDLLKDL